MYCHVIWFLKSVAADPNTIQIQILQVCLGAENALVGVTQWAADTIQIWHDTSAFTTQWIDRKVMKGIWVITQSMSISNMKCTNSEQLDFLIDHSISSISNLCKMYSTYLRPPGVTERMWSVNVDVSISGEYGMQGGHSGHHSE